MTLPLPIALLRRRARNAKSPKERHDTAYFAWEASIRLAAAAVPVREPETLVAPSIGRFVQLLGERAEEAPALDDDGSLRLYARLTEVGQDRRSAPRSVSGAKLLESIPAYRNRVLGHGATRANDFYEQAGEELLAGLDAVWRSEVFRAPDAQLLWVEGIELAKDGSRVARVLVLEGLASEAESVAAAPETLAPGRVYLRRGAVWTSLHPWILYEPGELRERILFFNGRTRAARFLDYVSGEELRGKALTDTFPGVGEDVDRALHTPSTPSPVEATPDADTFGDYKILGKIGEGGMGVVHLAEQRSLGRIVALKMLPAAAADDATAVARFEREIAALSRCDHPNVVKILASGVERGTHYYAMELVEGADLAQIGTDLRSGKDFAVALDSASERVRNVRKEASARAPSAARVSRTGPPPRGSVTELVGLFRDAALALQHLHEAGIVHRDVKPANLMVTSVERRVVLMDLGLAALGDASRTLTRDASSLLGTLRYMPPEQLQRNLLDVDHRADVYALGATFYELLTGRPLFDGDTEARLIEQILRAEPVPATRANAALAKDLGVILEKATRKDPKERYATAAALAADLTAFMEGRPIAARPPTLRYVLFLTIRRHRVAAALSALFVLLFVALVVLSFRREQALRREADTQRIEAQRSREDSDRAAIQILTDEGRSESLEGNHGRAVVLLAEAYRRGGTDPALRQLLSQELRSSPASLHIPHAHAGAIRAIAASQGGARVATGGVDGVVRVWDAATGARLVEVDAKAGEVVSLQFGGQRWLLAAYGDGSARLLQSLDGKLMATFRAGKRIFGADITDDGSRVALATDDGASMWDATGALVARLAPLRGAGAFVNFDGGSIFAGGEGGAGEWDKMTGKPLASFDGVVGRAVDLAVWGDSSWVFVGDDDGAVSVFPRRGGKSKYSFRVRRPIRSLVVDYATLGSDAPLEVRVRVGRADGGVQRWSVRGGEHDPFASSLLSTIGGPEAPVLASSPNAFLAGRAGGGVTLFSETGDGTVFDAVWHPTSASYDGAWMLGTGEGDLVVWKPVDPAVAVNVWALQRGGFEPIALSRDGTLLALADTVLDASGGADLGLHFGAGTRENSVRPSFAGDRLATGGSGLTVTDMREGRTLLDVTPAVLGGSPSHIALSQDGATVLAAAGGHVVAHRVTDGSRVADVDVHGVPLSCLLTAPDGSFVACAGDTVYRVELPSNRVTELHTPRVLDACLSADGTRLATASVDGTARVWDLATGATLATLLGHAAEVSHVRFLPSGDVVTGGGDGSAKVWDAVRGTPRISSDAHAGGVTALAVAPDGVRIATADAKHGVRIWDARSGATIARFESWQPWMVGKVNAGRPWVVDLVFAPDGARLYAASTLGGVYAIDVRGEDRTPVEVSRAVDALALPWALDGARLVRGAH